MLQLTSVWDQFYATSTGSGLGQTKQKIQTFTRLLNTKLIQIFKRSKIITFAFWCQTRSWNISFVSEPPNKLSLLQFQQGFGIL